MALQSSGTISLNQIHIEGGGSTGTAANLNESDIRNLIFKSSGASMSFSDFYSAGKTNGLFQLQEITVSNFITSGGTFEIPTGAYLWSNDTTVASIIVDIPCTIINNSIIMGKGGAGGTIGSRNGSAGGPAISITSTGVTITNNSGSYILGGGGGGAAATLTGGTSGGGGGAGGGAGGAGTSFSSGAGGSIGQPGVGVGATNAGGGGGGGSSGGGRQVPGAGGDFVAPFDNPSPSGIGDGGDAGVAGGEGGLGSNSNYAQLFFGGGGGGWGAAGGGVSINVGTSGLLAASGGAAGAAINPNGNAYTLNNSGTIYGTTT